MTALISSPVAYPPSSSPAPNKRSLPTFASRKTDHGSSGRAEKRRKIEKTGPTTNEVEAETTGHKSGTQFGAFIDADSEDEDSSATTLNPPKDASVDLLVISASQALPRDESRQSASLPLSHLANRKEAKTCSGKSINIVPRKKTVPISFEQLVAARSTTKAGRAKKSYYGIDVQDLIEQAKKDTAEKLQSNKTSEETTLQSIETPIRSKRSLMWTEKYRARSFFDLVGDDRTHRDVLRWLKGWDPTVFPGSGKPKPVVSKRPDGEPEEKPHRKILMLTGPPGLGKTTLAHVCAVQAGYEVMEINASDERSSNVVKGRIRTSVGTESVKNVSVSSKKGPSKMARPVCVVIDEVDGVVGGSGGSGEGGFIKALIDLIQLDAKNSAESIASNAGYARKKKGGDKFRLLRPIVLICNDVYHPSLRPLRQSSFAEVIHIRKPPLEAVANRMKVVFEKEGVQADNDAVRKLCEATWGMSSGPEARLSSAGTGEGDIRSVLVTAESAASKLRSEGAVKPRLTKKWVEDNLLGDLGHGGGGARGVGRGGVKDVVSRVFITGAGFPKPPAAPIDLRANSAKAVDSTEPRSKLHSNEIAKKAGMDRLREMVDTSGESDRIVTDIFSVYPSQQFNDDSILSKPDAAYEWMHFSDACSSKVYTNQDWELMPYLSQPILACHHLFAAPARHFHSFEKSQASGRKWGEDVEEEKELPFTGPKADYDAKEAEKQSRAVLAELQGSLNASLLRSFRSPEDVATDLLPYLIRMLSPEVKPVVVGGSGEIRGVASVRKESERGMIRRAVDVMSDVGVRYERGKLEGSRGTEWVYRMEPPIDELIHFPTAPNPTSTLSTLPTRYAVRQVLDQEYTKNIIVRENAARQARFKAGNPDDDSVYTFSSLPGKKAKGRETGRKYNPDELPLSTVKKDFFGRVLKEIDGNGTCGANDGGGKSVKKDGKVWVTFHEGFSNAVRKPVTVEELMRGL